MYKTTYHKDSFNLESPSFISDMVPCSTVKESDSFCYCAYMYVLHILRSHLEMTRKTQVFNKYKRIFCTVYDHAGKADLFES